MKRWFALLMALCLMMSAAWAEEVPLSQLLPLVDAAAGQELGEAAQGRYCGVRPMAVDASDAGDAVRILGDVYLADGQLEALTAEQYAQVQWLDRRAVVELRKAEDGWAVASFSLDAEWEMEQAAQDYFTDTMVEYVNAEMGFSIQYPAVFGEENVTVTAQGISGSMEGASFRVECLPNEKNWTIQTLLDGKKQETSGAEANIDTTTGMGRLVATVRGETIVCAVYVTPTHVYQAELRYDQSLIREFLHYSDYMMNSFTVDELGLG